MNNNYEDIRKIRCIFIFIGALFFLIGLIGFTFTNKHQKNLIQNESVTGFLDDTIESYDSEGDTVYKGVYKYTYEEIEHQYTSEVAVSPKSLLKDEITIYIDEDGNALGSSSDKVVIYIFVIFEIFGAVFICVGIRIKRKSMKQKGYY